MTSKGRSASMSVMRLTARSSACCIQWVERLPIGLVVQETGCCLVHQGSFVSSQFFWNHHRKIFNIQKLKCLALKAKFSTGHQREVFEQPAVHENQQVAGQKLAVFVVGCRKPVVRL